MKARVRYTTADWFGIRGKRKIEEETVNLILILELTIQDLVLQ